MRESEIAFDEIKSQNMSEGGKRRTSSIGIIFE